MSNFKTATKNNVRYVTPKGHLSTEQLWGLTLTDLAASITAVKKILKKSDDDDLGFLTETIKSDPTEQLRFDVLKEVYLEKKADNEAVRNAREKKEHNNKILALIEEKKETGLKNKSVEELEALLMA